MCTCSGAAVTQWGAAGGWPTRVEKLWKAAEREAKNDEMKATMATQQEQAKQAAAKRATEKDRIEAQQAQFYADLRAKKEAAEAANSPALLIICTGSAPPPRSDA